MRLLVLFILLVGSSGCGRDPGTLAKRTDFWRRALDREVPVGTSAEVIERWGIAHRIQFDLLKEQHWLYANVEQVPESGVPFPCSQWNIIVQITLDATNHSTKNEVTNVGTCV